MSRTNLGEKGAGHEYWSRRPGNKFGGIVGTFQKKQTHSIERLEGKQHTRQADDYEEMI